MKVTHYKVFNPTNEVKDLFLEDVAKFVDTEVFEDEQYAEYFGDDDTDSIGNIFTFLPEGQTEKFIKTLQKHNMLIESNDITTGVLFGDFDNKIWKRLFVDVLPDAFSSKSVLDNFLTNNLTRDIVLDKMNEKGFDALNEIDLQILKA